MEEIKKRRKERLKVFFLAFAASIPFWWGMNLLEENLTEIFFIKNTGFTPGALKAQAAYEGLLVEKMKPIKKNSAKEPEIFAESAISLFWDGDKKEKILFEKKSEEILPIASLAKLMTAKIAIDNYNLSEEIIISKESVSQKENFGKLEAGKSLKVKYLLYPLLMESSNDAAFALANDYKGMTNEKFVELMNKEAEKIGLENTKFYNPMGLDPEDAGQSFENINHSTAKDLAFLTRELFKSPFIWKILSAEKYNYFGPELINTNELLNTFPEAMGGKTGYTERAGKCMMLTIKAPNNQGYLINVILNSRKKFEEMEELTNWAKNSYLW